MPRKSASTNFVTLHCTLPHKFSDPGAVLKEMFPNINPMDPRILGLQRALRDLRDNVDQGLRGVSTVVLPIDVQTSSNTRTANWHAM